MSEQFGESKTGAIDAAKRNQLVCQYYDYVHRIVRRLLVVIGSGGLTYDDHVSAGCMGLIEAAQRFDSTAGKDFRAYATPRIRGAVIDNIRAQAVLSGRAYRYAKALRAAQDLHEIKGNIKCDTPADRETALASVLDFAANGALAFKLSLSDVESEVKGLPASEGNPEIGAIKIQDAKIIRQLIATLPSLERKILEDYYFRDRNLVEITNEIEGGSKCRISRLHARALQHLKELYLEHVDGVPRPQRRPPGPPRQPGSRNRRRSQRRRLARQSKKLSAADSSNGVAKRV